MKFVTLGSLVTCGLIAMLTLIRYESQAVNKPLINNISAINTAKLSNVTRVDDETRVPIGAEPATEISATFSILAVDPESGSVGMAVASKYPAVGKVVGYVRAGVGGICTQHHHVPAWGEPALDALQQGKSPEVVIADLLRDDPGRELRQLAVIDMTGRAAQHNPTAAPERSFYWGSMAGRFYCCQGNTLAGRGVINEMARAYEETTGSLADRLMAALVAGECAGGDHRGKLAAGIRVAKTGVEGNWFELYVDESDNAVIDLAQKYAETEHDAKGEWEGAKLPFTPPCR
jgi:uncharacterized Ntn-hydrolase superfamily protein